jgi:glycosyltransferase involved in cell wall biosynthesis
VRVHGFGPVCRPADGSGLVAAISGRLPRQRNLCLQEGPRNIVAAQPKALRVRRQGLAPQVNQVQMTPDTINCVDVIIAAWNRPGTIERAILSALAQPEVRSVIVVDDCSTDDTRTRALRIAAEHVKRVTVVGLSANSGPAAARNFGLKISTAPWIGILDADDFFLPGRIGTLLSEATELDFIADNIFQVKQGREKERQVALLEGMDGAWNLDFQTFVLGNVSQWGSLRKELGFLKPLMRRSFLDCHELRYDESLRLGEDYALYSHALALRARFRVLPICGYVSAVLIPCRIWNVFAILTSFLGRSMELRQESGARSGGITTV